MIARQVPAIVVIEPLSDRVTLPDCDCQLEDGRIVLFDRGNPAVMCAAAAEAATVIERDRQATFLRKIRARQAQRQRVHK